MLPMVKRKSSNHRRRLSTEELGDLLGCSKNSVVRTAKKYQWKKEQCRNSYGQLVTTYSMIEVKKAFPDLESKPQQAAEKAVTKTATTDYETPELVEAVQMMVREYVAIQRLTVESQEKAVQRIVKVFAANIGLMLILAIAVGMSFWQWHNTEINNLKQSQFSETNLISANFEEPYETKSESQAITKSNALRIAGKSLHLSDVAMGEIEEGDEGETWPEE